MSASGRAQAPADGDTAPSAPTIEIEIVWCPTPTECRVQRLRLPAGSVLGDAASAAGWVGARGTAGATPANAPGGAADEAVPAQAGAATAFGVWGKVQPLDHALRDGDRVERYRPLKVDPKEARRLRQARQRDLRSGQRSGRPTPDAPR